MGLTKDKWVWMPHNAHLIIGHRCRFTLATYVGGYIVSTVGEWPDDSGQGFQKIGSDYKYETMVFKARRMNEPCCKWEAIIDQQVDFDTYNDPGAANKGHMRLCKKWADN